MADISLRTCNRAIIFSRSQQTATNFELPVTSLCSRDNSPTQGYQENGMLQ